MTITITTTTAVETLDDAIDALASLREIGVDEFAVNGQIVYADRSDYSIVDEISSIMSRVPNDQQPESAINRWARIQAERDALLTDEQREQQRLGNERIGALKGEIEALRVHLDAQEAELERKDEIIAGMAKPADSIADDLTRRTLEQLEMSERIGILTDVWPSEVSAYRRGLDNQCALDEVFLTSRRERIIEVASYGPLHNIRDQMAAGLVQAYFARPERAAATEQLINLIGELRYAAEAELADVADRFADKAGDADEIARLQRKIEGYELDLEAMEVERDQARTAEDVQHVYNEVESLRRDRDDLRLRIRDCEDDFTKVARQRDDLATENERLRKQVTLEVEAGQRARDEAAMLTLQIAAVRQAVL